MKVFIVMLSSMDEKYVEEVFTTKELAVEWIKHETGWEEKFKKEFGVSYGDAPSITEEMEDWLFVNTIHNEDNYYILEKTLYDHSIN